MFEERRPGHDTIDPICHSALIILLFLTGCSENPEEMLNERADAWSKVITEARNQKDEDAVRNIESFLDPTKPTTQAAKMRLRQFRALPSRMKSPVKIEELSFNSNSTKGTVTYNFEWEMPDGSKKTKRQETEWIRVNGKWYRSVDEGEFSTILHANNVACLQSLKSALSMYEIDTGSFPDRLDVLVKTIRSYGKISRTSYLSEIPKDPWGNDYVYKFPGTTGPRSFDLFSIGPDGIEGTSDDIR
jgi:type II secretion system protein G